MRRCTTGGWGRRPRSLAGPRAPHPPRRCSETASLPRVEADRADALVAAVRRENDARASLARLVLPFVAHVVDDGAVTYDAVDGVRVQVQEMPDVDPEVELLGVLWLGRVRLLTRPHSDPALIDRVVVVVHL